MSAVPDPEAFDHVLRTTRSVRRKLDFERKVEPEVIEECIAVATQAPTGLQREGWRFVVVTEPEPKAALGALYRSAFDAFLAMREELVRSQPGLEVPAPRPAQLGLADRLHEFPALILVCSVGRPPVDVARQVAFFGSVLPAAWSLMLALRARGIGATWTTLLASREQEAARVLGIPEDVTQTVLLPVGYMRDAVLRPADRKPPAAVTYWNGWGRSRE